MSDAPLHRHQPVPELVELWGKEISHVKAAQTVVLLLPVICRQGGNEHWVFGVCEKC